MADNVTADPGSGGATFASNDIAGIQYPRTKIALGAAGAHDMDLDSGQQTMANSVPVAIASDQSALTVAQATAANLNVTEASAAAIKTAAEIMDDWDETDRAKVNLIVGQAGIAAGAGAVGATVPRMTLASDDPGVALLGTIDADTGAIATAVQVMDDWDESDRAKVNIIVGQAGITAGAGAVGASTPRVTLASDDPAVASLATLDNIVAGNEAQVDVVTLPAKKLTYAASAALTQTNLDGLASSSTHLAGWESGAIDNSTNLYLDYIINAKIQLESAGLSAGEIRMYLVAELEDSSWPDVFDGTESGETVTSAEIRDAICRPAAATATTTTASRTYYLNCPSAATVFGGTLPRKFVIFITQSSGAALETTGDPNQVYVKGVYLT